MMNTTRTTPRERASDQRAHRLLVVWAPPPIPTPASASVCVLGDEPVQLGRLTQSGQRCFVLEHAEVSRAHARVEPSGSGGFVLHDLGSHNGSFVNGRQVERHVLSDGDIVRVGSHLLLYQVLTAEQCELLLQPARFPHGALRGSGARMLSVRRAIAGAARGQAPVLVLGESGVGKELVARALHEQSGRKGRFVAVNCAALPPTLIESELFGHVRGAFTGADQAAAGLFEEAQGGTLLLDEIGDMPLLLQAKLLRALATGEVRRVGETRSRHVDVKVLAATNVALDEAVSQGRFRGDLYARLLGVTIEVPPLRERREDVFELARHFLLQRGAGTRIEADAAEALLAYHWPFNVRELEQIAAAAAEQGDGSGLRLRDLPERLRVAVPQTGAEPAPNPLAHVARDAVPGRQELAEVLEHFGGNIKRSAAFFARDRRVLYRWCQQHGLDPKDFRQE